MIATRLSVLFTPRGKPSARMAPTAIFISSVQAIGVVDDRRGVVVSLGVGAGAPAVSGLGRVAADPERHGDDVGRDPRSLRSSASMRPYCRRCMVCAWSL